MLMIVIMIISQLSGKGKDDVKGISLTKELFKTTATFNIVAFVICIITAVLYALFW